MNKALTLLLCFVGSCAAPPAAVPARQQPAAGDTVSSEGERVRHDLESSVRSKFGDKLAAEGLSAPTFILAKRYVGLPRPILQPDGAYRFAEPPVAMLVRRGGVWLAAKVDGTFAPVPPENAAGINAVVNDPAFSAEPSFTPPTCTDAGGDLLWLNAEGRPATVRQSACGSAARTERLVLLALES